MTLDKFDFNFNVDVMQQDLDRVEKKSGQLTAKQADKYVVLPKGEGYIAVRLLPPDTPKGRVLPYASTRLHYINNRSYHCLKEIQGDRWGGNCPICNYYNYLYRMADAASVAKEAEGIRNTAKSFKPVERYYYNSIVRSERDMETGEIRKNVGPKIFSVGKSVHSRILMAFVGNKKFDKKPIGNIAHPLTGRDFKLIKVISKSDGREYPNYDESVFEDESKLGTDEQIHEWLNKMWDLEAERRENLKSFDELQHQIDIVQGKAVDESTSLDASTNNFSLPVELGGSVSSSITEAVKSVVPPSFTAVKEVPFDADISGDGVDEDWVKDLQKKLNIKG